MADQEAQLPWSEAEVRRRLEAERQRLQGLIDDVLTASDAGDDETESVGALSSADQHPADLGSETAAREANEGLVDSMRAELAEIQDALARLEEGSYGRCVICHRPIGRDRLEALPATPFCLEHAQQAEFEAARGGESAG